MIRNAHERDHVILSGESKGLEQVNALLALNFELFNAVDKSALRCRLRSIGIYPSRKGVLSQLCKCTSPTLHGLIFVALFETTCQYESVGCVVRKAMGLGL